jgi:exodeoxyribonuclease I
MQKTYLFYDLETSGLNKAFDQVLQFAAIRTDLDLNEIERHEIIVRLSPDIIPSPGGIIIHQISLKEMSRGIPEAEAIAKIHELLNTPGTISLGYNTLGFDDEFLRFSFYRNLLPPYTHQFANNCSRLDIAPLIPLYFLYKPDVIQWPKKEDKISFKLEELSRENQLAVGAAHNAMVDVIATVELAKLLRRESKTWQYALEFFDKTIALERVNKLASAFICQQQNFREGLLITGFHNSAYQSPVLALGGHNHYKNKTLWLRLDDEKLSRTTPDTIAENAWVYALKAGEANFILPLTEHYAEKLSPERRLQTEQNKTWLQEHPDLLFEIMNYHKEFIYPKIPDLDIDAALYQNDFFSDNEKQLCDHFHSLPLPDKAVCLDKLQGRLRTLAIRLIGRNYPEYLPEKYQQEFDVYLDRIAPDNEDNALSDYKNKKRLTPKAALLEINKLKTNTFDSKKIQLLDELEIYIQEKF